MFNHVSNTRLLKQQKMNNFAVSFLPVDNPALMQNLSPKLSGEVEPVGKPGFDMVFNP